MTAIHFESALDDERRRARLYAGDIFVLPATPAATALCAHASAMIEEAFAPHDPRSVHSALPVERCVEILAQLKPRFIHHPLCKELIQNLLAEQGCDPQLTYFDVPRLRSAMPHDYLASGIAYAFHPHRDTWYSAPFVQLNWWLPVYDLHPENCLAFHPRYFDLGVKNGSAGYNYYRWNAQNRGTAAQHIKQDTRVQPKAEEPIELDPQIRILAKPGSSIVFSAQQMHSTVPNTSNECRWSIDFRTIHLGDARARGGARNVDSACTGTTMRDYLRATDLSHVPDDVVALYDDDTAAEGVVTFLPSISESESQAGSGSTGAR